MATRAAQAEALAPAAPELSDTTGGRDAGIDRSGVAESEGGGASAAVDRPHSDPYDADDADTDADEGAIRHRWLLRVCFRGAGFSGYQRQEGQRTVQGTLEESWAAWQNERVLLRGSSRTDAGVHARALPVLLRTARTLPAKALLLGWNAHLPDDVAIAAVEAVPEAFHIRNDAIGKRYLYRIWNARPRSPRHAVDHWHVGASLDVPAMAEAAALLAGDHDFSAFRAAGCQSPTTWRTLRGVSLQAHADEAVAGARVIVLTVEGNAFLQHMVRIIAGTLVAVGRGQRCLADVKRALAEGDRRAAGQTAPPNGLELDAVAYGPPGARQGLEHKALLARMAALDGGGSSRR